MHRKCTLSAFKLLSLHEALNSEKRGLLKDNVVFLGFAKGLELVIGLGPGKLDHVMLRGSLQLVIHLRRLGVWVLQMKNKKGKERQKNKLLSSRS